MPPTPNLPPGGGAATPAPNLPPSVGPQMGPMSTDSMASIPLGRHEDAPGFDLPSAPTTGEFCPKCRTPMYQTMVRCPNCQEPYTAARKSRALSSLGPSVRIRVAKERRRHAAPILAVVVAVSVAALAGLGVLVYSLTASHDGALNMEGAVRSFYNSLLESKIQQSLKFVSPDHRKQAKEAIQLLEQAQIPIERVVGRVVQSMGWRQLDFEIGQQKETGEDKGTVEVLFRSGGLPMRRTTVPVARHSGRWYVDLNPFGGPGH